MDFTEAQRTALQVVAHLYAKEPALATQLAAYMVHGEGDAAMFIMSLQGLCVTLLQSLDALATATGHPEAGADRVLGDLRMMLAMAHD